MFFEVTADFHVSFAAIGSLSSWPWRGGSSRTKSWRPWIKQRPRIVSAPPSCSAPTWRSARRADCWNSPRCLTCQAWWQGNISQRFFCWQVFEPTAFLRTLQQVFDLAIQKYRGTTPCNASWLLSVFTIPLFQVFRWVHGMEHKTLMASMSMCCCVAGCIGVYGRCKCHPNGETPQPQWRVHESLVSEVPRSDITSKQSMSAAKAAPVAHQCVMCAPKIDTWSNDTNPWRRVTSENHENHMMLSCTEGSVRAVITSTCGPSVESPGRVAVDTRLLGPFGSPSALECLAGYLHPGALLCSRLPHFHASGCPPGDCLQHWGRSCWFHGLVYRLYRMPVVTCSIYSCLSTAFCLMVVFEGPSTFKGYHEVEHPKTEESLFCFLKRPEPLP